MSASQALSEVFNSIKGFAFTDLVAQARQEPVILGLVLLVATFAVSGITALVSGASFLSTSVANAFAGSAAGKRRDDSGFPPGWPEDIDAAPESPAARSLDLDLARWKDVAVRSIRSFLDHEI